MALAPIRGQLRRTGGDLADTARRSGIAPRSLFTKLQELGLDKREFQQGEDRRQEGSRRRPSRTGRS